VLLDFWSLTCPPCIEEMRHLRGVHRKSNGEFNIVSINIDPPSYQRDQQVVEMANGKGLEFPVLLDDGPVGSAYDIEIMPTLFLIDADGKIARVFKGVTGEAVISKAFESVAGQ
jgi:thiol-disulfide isomerase/thioredoxin